MRLACSREGVNVETLTLHHIERLGKRRLRQLRDGALAEAALLPRYKLQQGGLWDEDTVVRRLTLIMAANDCEALLAGRALIHRRARRDWHTSMIGLAEYLA